MHAIWTLGILTSDATSDKGDCERRPLIIWAAKPGHEGSVFQMSRLLPSPERMLTW